LRRLHQVSINLGSDPIAVEQFGRRVMRVHFGVDASLDRRVAERAQLLWVAKIRQLWPLSAIRAPAFCYEFAGYLGDI
jgi:hypothetical protein